MFKTGIGQDSHRFEDDDSKKPLVLGGMLIPECRGLRGNSDADVALHALTNAISGISGDNILGKTSDDMCLNKGITDSKTYLAAALKTLPPFRVVHASISIEAKRPRLEPHIDAIKASIAKLLSLSVSDIGLTATSGEGLTAFGRGEGMQAFAIVTATDAA